MAESSVAAATVDKTTARVGLILGILFGLILAGIVSFLASGYHLRANFGAVTHRPKETRANVVYVVPFAEVGRTIAARTEAGETYLATTPLRDVVDEWPSVRDESEEMLQPQLLFFRSDVAPWNGGQRVER